MNTNTDSDTGIGVALDLGHERMTPIDFVITGSLDDLTCLSKAMNFYCEHAGKNELLPNAEDINDNLINLNNKVLALRRKYKK